MPALSKRSAKILPTWRMSPAKQLEVLRAYAAACGDEPRGVTNSEVASIVGLKADTVSMVNGFFASVELLTKGDSGYVPSQEILNYARAFQWKQETAFRETAPKLASSWFAEAIIPKLRFKPLSIEEAIGVIGQAGGVGPEDRREIELSLWFLEQSGIIERENGTVRLGQAESKTDGEAAQSQPAVTAIIESRPRTAPPVEQKSSAGAIRLNVEINVDMEEIAKWKPERITAFMTGLAQVLAAKGETEQSLS